MPEYTAELGIVGRMKVIVLTALELEYAGVWRECLDGEEEIGREVILGDAGVFGDQIGAKAYFFGYDVGSSADDCFVKRLNVVKSR